MARVLVTGFCAVPGPDRAGVQLSHVLRALAPHHVVDVLTLRKGDQAYVERFRKTRVLRVPVPDEALGVRVDSFRRALRRQLEGAEYDIVHFCDGWSGLPVLELRDRLRYQTVFDVARAPVAEPPLYDLDLAAALARDEEACLLAADLVLAPTEPARRMLAERGHPQRVRLVPPGVDVDRFDWEPPDRAGPPRILYAGALAPGRGIRVLLRGMLEVAARTDARLVLAGEIAPAFAEPLRAALEGNRLAGRVDFVGPVDNEDMPAVIAQSAVCVVPAAAELTPSSPAVYPTKLLEYMACRRAVVAPRRGTTALCVRHEETGLMFAPGDATDLAAQILRLLADVPLRERLAEAGYDLVRRAHTASASRRALRAAYAAVEEAAAWQSAGEAEVTDSQLVGLAPIGRGRATLPRERALLGELAAPRGTLLDIEPDTDSGLYADPPTVISAPPDNELTLDLAAPAGPRPADEPGSGAWVVRDGEASVTPSSPVDARFAAGEVDAAAPPSPRGDDEAETVFVAAGAILGQHADDTDPKP